MVAGPCCYLGLYSYLDLSCLSGEEAHMLDPQDSRCNQAGFVAAVCCYLDYLYWDSNLSSIEN
jgi:hypothetical protein